MKQLLVFASYLKKVSGTNYPTFHQITVVVISQNTKLIIDGAKELKPNILLMKICCLKNKITILIHFPYTHFSAECKEISSDYL